MIIIGKDFNSKYKNKKFYKLLNEDENHNGFQFRDGINKDIEEFNPTGKCQKGGLYFTDEDNISFWLFYKDIKYIREVKILDESKVYKEERGFKTDKFFLKERILIEDFNLWKDEKFCLKAVKLNPRCVKYTIKSIKILKTAIKEDPSIFNEFKEYQTYELCLFIIKISPYLVLDMMDIKEEFRDYKLCKIAVSLVGVTLKFFDKKLQDNIICKLAVSNSGVSLEHVREDLKNYKTCKLAVSNNGRSLEYVPNLIKDYKLCEIAVNNYGMALEYVDEKFQDYKLCILSLKKSLCQSFRYVFKKIQDYEMCVLVVGYSGLLLEHVREELQTQELCNMAINKEIEKYEKFIKENNIRIPNYVKKYDISISYYQDNIGKTFKFVKEEFRSYKMCETVVGYHGLSIEYVNKYFRNYKICNKAYKNNKSCLKHLSKEDIEHMNLKNIIKLH